MHHVLYCAFAIGGAREPVSNGISNVERLRTGSHSRANHHAPGRPNRHRHHHARPPSGCRGGSQAAQSFSYSYTYMYTGHRHADHADHVDREQAATKGTIVP